MLSLTMTSVMIMSSNVAQALQQPVPVLRQPASSSALFSTASKSKKKGYVTKWTKKKTLAEEDGSSGGGDDVDSYNKKGITGSIPVVFKARSKKRKKKNDNDEAEEDILMGSNSVTSTTFPGQPLRDVASQAGQFIPYNCKKGQCGACSSRIKVVSPSGNNDNESPKYVWVRPCVDIVPTSIRLSSPSSVAGDNKDSDDAATSGDGDVLVFEISETKSKIISSGKFFSAKSFLLGFWNNAIGMVGFVRDRRKAKRNWNERQEYEQLIVEQTLAKKRSRAKQQQRK